MNKQIYTLGVLAALALAGGAHAQGGKYGTTPEDSVTCVQSLSLYQEFFNQGKNYADAYGPWTAAMRTCPASSKKMYVDGNIMLKNFIAKEKDAARKQLLIDSLYLVHDRRIDNFGEQAFVLGRKGQDMTMYSPDDCKGAHDVLLQAIELGGDRSEDVTLSAYYSVLNCLYGKDEVTKDHMLNEYVRIMAIIEKNLARDMKESERSYWVTARDNVNTLFFKVAECTDIGRIVDVMLKERPDDKELNSRLLRILTSKECTEEKVYLPLAERVHRDDPSPESAYSLAMYLIKRNDLAGGGRYLKEALDLCGNCPDRAKFLLKLAQVSYAMGNSSTARGYANQVLQLEPRNGEAMIVVGDAISAQAGDCDVPQKWGVYWLAYDHYQRAKSQDASVADKAGDRMARAAAHFPSKSDAFFHQLTDAQSFQVTCGGLSESTTVRTKK